MKENLRTQETLITHVYRERLGREGQRGLKDTAPTVRTVRWYIKFGDTYSIFDNLIRKPALIKHECLIH